jgi:protein-tyrosine-phosphatase
MSYVVMFVCTGNTCRSPMAHGILQSMIEREKIDDVTVISTGTGTLDGYPVSLNSVGAAAKDGVDISQHHSTAITPELIDESDLILTMSYQHLFSVIAMYPKADGKVFMLKAFPDSDPSPELTVHDPIGTDFENYMSTYSEIKAELVRIWPAIKQRIDEKLH